LATSVKRHSRQIRYW